VLHGLQGVICKMVPVVTPVVDVAGAGAGVTDDVVPCPGHVEVAVLVGSHIMAGQTVWHVPVVVQGAQHLVRPGQVSLHLLQEGGGATLTVGHEGAEPQTVKAGQTAELDTQVPTFATQVGQHCASVPHTVAELQGLQARGQAAVEARGHTDPEVQEKVALAVIPRQGHAV
jgi:hypothetical protein